MTEKEAVAAQHWIPFLMNTRYDEIYEHKIW